MEKEINEVLMENGVDTELGTVNRKASKGMFLGIAAVAVSALLFRFRNKISSRIEGSMVKKLSKKGYIINSPEELKELSEDIMEAL